MGKGQYEIIESLSLRNLTPINKVECMYTNINGSNPREKKNLQILVVQEESQIIFITNIKLQWL